MAAGTSAAIIAARDNSDLKDRARALGATLGMTAVEVDAVWDRVVVADVDNTGTSSIATVFEYAKLTYDQAVAALPPEPGVNPAAVTDTQILHALQGFATPAV
ncbi:hypothetical protein [Actinomyces culturomici]|uniref:hypothetical protein n=1 Tax=Actinomyces culturomici TaxID=1926276 RepID=UPI000E1FF50A|nr:hypothetical protein [Actinomyces culturomici]